MDIIDTPLYKQDKALSTKEREEFILKTQKEVLRSTRNAFKTTEDMERTLKKMYEQAEKDIKSKVLKMAEKVDEWSMSDMQKYDRYQKLLAQIEEEAQKLGDKEVKYITQQLKGVYENSYLNTVYALGQSTNVTANLTTIYPRAIEKAVKYPFEGAMFSDRIWDNKGKLVTNLREGLTQSLIQGESIPQMSRRINEGLNKAYYKAERVARSETMRVYYSAEKEAYKENKIKELQFWATVPSERTCPECGELHTDTFKEGEEPMLPIHPNCRCRYLPIVPDILKDEKMEELGNELTKLAREYKSFNGFKDNLTDEIMKKSRK